MTGATGFVGWALVRQLLATGARASDLRLLVRDRGRAQEMGLPPESLVAGDLRDDQALRRAARGADLVFHVAGAIRALSRQHFDEVNAHGTARLVAAVGEAAPGCRLVHVSSLAAAGPSRRGETSALPPESCRPRSGYGASKREGELHVQELGDRVSWIIVRPPIVYGPGDAGTRLLFRQALAPLVAVPWRRRPVSLIHIRDLVRVLMLAAESPVARRVLPVEGPERSDTTELMRSIAAACDRRARIVRVPLLAAWPVAWWCDLAARFAGRAAIFGRDKLRDVAARGWVADAEPARQALGFEPEVGLEAGWRETARAEGL